MQHVITYDISDDRRRERLAQALLNFGPRVEESVFVANLDEELSARLLERIERIVDKDFDRVHVFLLCSGCEGKTKLFGTAERVEDKEFYIL